MRSLYYPLRMISEWWGALLVVVAGIAIQIFLVTREFLFLLENLLPDDAYFYFNIARNIVQGFGITSDGMHVTNGFHPLWMLVVSLITKASGALTPGDTTAIYWALYLAVAMNLISTIFVWRILTRFTQDKWAHALGLSVWMLNPYFLYETMNGLETSLALLLLSIFVLLVLRIEEGRPIDLPVRTGGYFLAGLVAAFVILARLDMALYVAAFILWTFFRRANWKDFLEKMIYFGVGLTPFLIWWVWNVITFKMLLTSSANTEMLIYHQLIVQDHGDSWFQFYKAIVYHSQLALDTIFQRSGMYALAAGAIGAFATLVLFREIRLPKRLSEINAITALFLGFVAIYIGNATIRWTWRHWYFVAFGLFLSVIIVVVLDRLLPRIKYKKTVAAFLLALMLFSFFVNWSKRLQPSKNDGRNQRENVQTALWMNANLPPDARVGTFMPGSQGLFSNIPVIDLDGWINNSAAEALKERRLWQYILDEKIEYVWDYGYGLRYRYKSFLGIDDPFARMELIHDLTNNPDGYRLYKIKSP